MTSLSANDCDDNLYTPTNICCAIAARYQDLDGDGYGNPGVSISACATAGYVDSNTDCYDADPGTTNAELAYPGSSTCSTANRGDGNYDYNCTSSQTHCGNEYYTASVYQRYRCGAQLSCVAAAEYYTVNTGSTTCGQAGYLNGSWNQAVIECASCEGPDFNAYNSGAAGNQACQ